MTHEGAADESSSNVGLDGQAAHDVTRHGRTTAGVTVTEAIAYDCGFRAGQAHARAAGGLLAALGAIRFQIAQQRGGALYPNDADGFEMALDDFDETARAAIAAAKGA